MQTTRLDLVLLIGLILITSGCGKRSSSPTPFPTDMPYVPPGRSPSSYLLPEEIYTFRLDKPIEAGATQVTGSGPAGVPILLIDITFGGETLAFGVINEDGHFELTLDTPLEANHRIGITLGDLTDTDWQPDDFTNPGFNGDEALNVPLIGFFYDTYLVNK